MKHKLNFISSTAIPLSTENIDTDQIIPARFLKRTNREGFGDFLFRDWRFENDDVHKPKEDFILNNEKYKGRILVAGRNFGCGSSREHAAWAIKDYGFDVVISSFFADIFRNNALNNFLLPIQVSEEVLSRLFQVINKNPQTILDIDLSRQLLEIKDIGEVVFFEISNYKKECLMEGLDDIDYLLRIRGEIEAFEIKNKLD